MITFTCFIVTQVNLTDDIVTFLPGLLSPKSLSFSEVTSRSFRAHWVSDSTDVLSFLVRFRPAADITGSYISLAVPGDTTTAVLPYLTPLTTYEVDVFAQYDKGDSFPLTGEETTLEGTGLCLCCSKGNIESSGKKIILCELKVIFKVTTLTRLSNWLALLINTEQGAVRNLRVTEETTDSFRVSWQAAPGAVLRYRLFYEPISGGERLEAVTDGSQTTIVLQELFPITTYRVTVHAEYASGMGAPMDTRGTTKEGQHWWCVRFHSFGSLTTFCNYVCFTLLWGNKQKTKNLLNLSRTKFPWHFLCIIKIHGLIQSYSALWNF